LLKVLTINEVIRYPEITKNTSTPTYPPAPEPAVKSTTARTARARSPSISGR